MNRADVLTFPIYRLRRGDNDLLDFQLFLDNQFVKQRSSNRVHMQEPREIRHIVLVGRLARDDIDVLQGRKKCATISYVSSDKIDAGGNVFWPTVRMAVRIARHQ